MREATAVVHHSERRPGYRARHRESPPIVATVGGGSMWVWIVKLHPAMTGEGFTRR
jgi:hypothetical protein